MCTVVVRWTGSGPVALLALRDELVGRDFDDPAEHWPALPGVVGGRDRAAGGTWCATHVPTGTTALVLNRPERREAAAGAPSRGALPLAAVAHGTSWPEAVDWPGMASFHLLLSSPDSLDSWVFDGASLTHSSLEPGLHVVTSGGPEDGKAERYRTALGAGPTGWRALVAAEAPRPDPSALVVRLERDDLVFATVFAQVMSVAPGRLEVEHSRTPAGPGGWLRQVW